MILAWLKETLDGLVTQPEAMTITEKKDELGILFTVSSTNRKDIGILIGRGGEHVNAIRILLRTYGNLRDVKASLKIITE